MGDVNPPTCRLARRMLAFAPMRRSLLAMALVVGSTGVASAGPYVGFGLGPTGTVSNDIPEGLPWREIPLYAANGRSGRVLGGYRFPSLPFIGSVSVEASIAAYGLSSQQREDYGGRQASIMGKYNYPLAGGFEVFGRLGLDHTWINSHNSNTLTGGSGDGVLLGVGAEYRFKLPMAAASAFVDYTYSHASIDEPMFTRGYSARMWTLGFTFEI